MDRRWGPGVRQPLLEVVRSPVGLTGDAVVVGVESVRIAARAAMPEEEDLRRALAAEVAAVAVGCPRRRPGQCDDERRKQGEKHPVSGQADMPNHDVPPRLGVSTPRSEENT